MSLMRWRDPVDMLPSFPNFFNSFFGNELGSVAKQTLPSVNVKETKDEFVLEVAAPGMQKDSFDVQLDNDVLTITGNKEERKEEVEEKWSRKEFEYTSFQRSFQLPTSVRDEKIEAEYKDGVLFVKVPKKEEAKMKAGKRIEIK